MDCSSIHHHFLRWLELSEAAPKSESCACWSRQVFLRFFQVRRPPWDLHGCVLLSLKCRMLEVASATPFSSSGNSWRSTRSYCARDGLPDVASRNVDQYRGSRPTGRAL